MFTNTSWTSHTSQQWFNRRKPSITRRVRKGLIFLLLLFSKKFFFSGERNVSSRNVTFGEWMGTVAHDNCRLQTNMQWFEHAARNGANTIARYATKSAGRKFWLKKNENYRLFLGGHLFEHRLWVCDEIMCSWSGDKFDNGSTVHGDGWLARLADGESFVVRHATDRRSTSARTRTPIGTNKTCSRRGGMQMSGTPRGLGFFPVVGPQKIFP
jgi:hypothetical protein